MAVAAKDGGVEVLLAYVDDEAHLHGNSEYSYTIDACE